MMDNLEVILPERWVKNLKNINDVTDEVAISFGMQNLMWLITVFESYLSNKMSAVQHELMIQVIDKVKTLHYEAQPRPLISFCRSNDALNIDENVYVFIKNEFHRCKVMLKDEKHSFLCICPTDPNLHLDAESMFVSIKSPCVLNQVDFVYLINNIEYTNLWLDISYEEGMKFKKEDYIPAILRCK